MRIDRSRPSKERIKDRAERKQASHISRRARVRMRTSFCWRLDSPCLSNHGGRNLCPADKDPEMMLIRGTKNNRVGYWKVVRRHLGPHG
jgi:hypothetical protein